MVYPDDETHREVDNDTVLDERSTRFGCRTFVIDPEKGFILNGERYPLHGVSRHQDRPHIGNALTHKEHKEDIELILEIVFSRPFGKCFEIYGISAQSTRPVSSQRS